MPIAGSAPPHPVFTPTAVPPDRLDDITVGRGEAIDRVVDRLRRAATGSTLAHTLVVGARGSGKTHALAVALHRFQTGPDGARLAIGWIAEDALSIGSYPDLLVEMIRVLDPDRSEKARAARRAKDSPALERLLLQAAGGRPLVVVLENLDRIFRALGQSGQSALRGFVETASSVLVIASTPLLFDGVSSREEPWYGSFHVEHLPTFSADEGTTLMQRLAAENGDTEFAAFLGSATGRSRLEAIQHLAGGSPRLWHILFGCATVPALDELVPAVEELLDQLAPYYQQRLWELPSTEQKLVVELGREAPVRTVQDLASATGLSNQAAATALGRLSDSRWVRGRKAPGTDRRSTHYELREPLLRHHLSYRDTRGGALPFIVEFLKAWFTRTERRNLLIVARPDSPSEKHVVGSLLNDPPSRSDGPWAWSTAADLLVAARCWIEGETAPDQVQGSRHLGLAIEAVVLAAVAGVANGDPRATRAQLHSAVEQAARAAELRGGTTTADRVAAGLGELRNRFSADDGDLLTLISACWDGPADPAKARDDVGLLAKRRADPSRLTLTIRDGFAFWTGEAEDPAAARDLYADLIRVRTRVLGPDHPDTLTSRHNHAHWSGEAGAPSAARDLYNDLIPVRTRVLGPHHPDTLGSRVKHAFSVGEAGDPGAARDLCVDLIIDCKRTLGDDHPDALSCRANHAQSTGEAGDPHGARDLWVDLINDHSRLLGIDHRDTLTSRAMHALWTGKDGDPAKARDLYAALSFDYTRVLGTDHPGTLSSGAAWVTWQLRSGGDGRPVIEQVGEAVYATLATLALDLTNVHGEQLTRLVRPMANPAAIRSVLTAVLVRHVDLAPGQRKADYRQAAAGAVTDVSEPLETFAAAVGGDAKALAGLPQELRSIAEELLALDATAADR